MVTHEALQAGTGPSEPRLFPAPGAESGDVAAESGPGRDGGRHGRGLGRLFGAGAAETPGKAPRQEKPHWEVLQQEQKLMEEKNKRKKALLAKAIAERSKRTQAETVKLKRIQKELQALDDLVSADVGILRNRIDQACLDYSSARKRFDKAEAEYVVAKLDLQKKSEIKEQLTEHLCTIIQQNEQRKARKLEELMQQLEVVVDEESLELEIEVEQMLLQQEGGALGQGVQLRKPVPPAAEVTTPQGNSQEDKIESLQAGGSEQLVEKTADSYSGDQGHSMR
uniref:Uncharacterized protein n=1 Tax=Sphaerodactylus townsendi TaxID=933632 RepID=A0ACB8F1U8_9SAUR